MLTCKQTSLLVSQSLDRPLSRRERWAVRWHLVCCVYCRRFVQQLKLIRTQLMAWEKQAVNSEEKLSSLARARITRQLDKFY